MGYNAPVRFLITNDDGIHSEGVRVLQEVASRFGDSVVVAPDRDRSGIGQAISLSRPLRLREARGYPGRAFALEGGTPADCVYVGLHHVLKGQTPDLVLSGINPGANLGWDVLYSGTAAGARESVLHGIPGIAFSLLGSSTRQFPFEMVTEWIAQVIEAARPLPEHTFLNVNIPSPLVGPIAGIRPTRLGHRYYSKEVVLRTDPRGGEYLWIGGEHVTMPDIVGSDCNAVREGWVSVTPLGCDSTDLVTLDALSARFPSPKSLVTGSTNDLDTTPE